MNETVRIYNTINPFIPLLIHQLPRYTIFIFMKLTSSNIGYYIISFQSPPMFYTPNTIFLYPADGILGYYPEAGKISMYIIPPTK